MYECGENRWGREEKSTCVYLAGFICDLQIPKMIKRTPGLHEGSYKGLCCDFIAGWSKVTSCEQHTNPSNSQNTEAWHVGVDWLDILTPAACLLLTNIAMSLLKQVPSSPSFCRCGHVMQLDCLTLLFPEVCPASDDIWAISDPELVTCKWGSARICD